MQYDAAKKSAGVAYVLWFFFGIFGAHRFYLAQTGTAVTQLLLFIFSCILVFAYGLGLLTLLVLGIWVFVDAFLIPGIVQKYNSALGSRLAL